MNQDSKASMMTHSLRNWPANIAEARVIQDRLRHKVCICPGPEHVNYVAGLDVSYPRNRSQPARAAAVVMHMKDLSVVDQAVVEQSVHFPYVPGYLSFREVPCLLAVLDRLSVSYDVIICDGQGLAHPKGFGLACHLGVLTDMPALGVAKSRLYGRYAPVAESKGAWQSLLDNDENVIGAVLRTRDKVKPVFVSVGHRMDISSALSLVLALCPRYRIPEPIRRADSLCARPKQDEHPNSKEHLE